MSIALKKYPFKNSDVEKRLQRIRYETEFIFQISSPYTYLLKSSFTYLAILLKKKASHQ